MGLVARTASTAASRLDFFSAFLPTAPACLPASTLYFGQENRFFLQKVDGNVLTDSDVVVGRRGRVLFTREETENVKVSKFINDVENGEVTHS